EAEQEQKRQAEQECDSQTVPVLPLVEEETQREEKAPIQPVEAAAAQVPEIDFSQVCQFLMGRQLPPHLIAALRARVEQQLRQYLQQQNHVAPGLWQPSDFAQLLALYDDAFFNRRLRDEFKQRNITIQFQYSSQCTRIAGYCKGAGSRDCVYTISISRPIMS